MITPMIAHPDIEGARMSSQQGRDQGHAFIPVAEPDLGPLEERLILEAVRSGWVSSLGAFIGLFEQQFAAFCEVEHGVATSNGTAALHLCLVAAGVGPGDEVIVPSLTFVATAAAVRHAGAIPVFVDCEPEIGTMDARAAEAAITPRTKAIIPVHLFGHPVDMDPLVELGEKHQVLVIEDAAEAHGARYGERRVGSLGHAACFSFYGNKVLTTGEGGMIVSRDGALVKRTRFLRDHAMDPTRRYWHPEVGFNYRLTNPQAALGVAQLSRFDEITSRRQHTLDLYREYAAELELNLLLNPSRSWATPTPWLVCGVLPDSFSRQSRDELLDGLRLQAIDSRPYFWPLHMLPPFVACRKVNGVGGDQMVNSESLAARGFNLPSSGSLGAEDVRRITATLSDLMRPAA